MILRSCGLLACLLLALAPCAAIADDAPRIDALVSPVTVRLRGLSAVSEDIAWASGQAGTVLRSTDAGKSWTVMHVPGAEALDLRDVHGFDGRSAVVMGAGPGDASRVFRTADGGARWTEVLRNPDPAGFFDCIDFDGARGVLLGDPVDGRFRIFRSRDGGRTWVAGIGPKAADGEAAFAASGTCVLLAGGGTLVATGGSRARVHYLPQRFEAKGDWQAIDAAFPEPAPSAGLFSLARRGTDVLAVGGDYRKPAAPAVVASVHAASTIQANAAAGAPGGYRSGIACKRGQDAMCVATGPDASDLLPASCLQPQAKLPACCDPGENALPSVTWIALSGVGYDSVANAGRAFWFSGDGGRLGRLVSPATAADDGCRLRMH